MTQNQESWAELSARLEALGLKLKLHLEQTGTGEITEAMTKLRQGMHDAFDAAGNAIHDEAVRSDIREVGRMFADAVSTTISKVSKDVKGTFASKP